MNLCTRRSNVVPPSIGSSSIQELRDEQQKLREQQEDEYHAREGRLQQLRDDIMAEKRRNSRTMRGVAWMTMAFLPATFVSSFFGMNFFTPVPGKAVFDEVKSQCMGFLCCSIAYQRSHLDSFLLVGQKSGNGQSNERKDRDVLDSVIGRVEKSQGIMV